MIRDRLPGLALALAGVACAIEATTFDVAFMTDPVGPKALPLLAAITLVLTGIHVARHPYRASVWPSGAAAARCAAAVVAFLTYAAALPWLGFFLATALVVTALSRLFGAPLRLAVPSAAALAGALWLLFVGALGLPLPIGELWIL